MTVTEKQRHELIKRFEETLGPEHAETMMELLPPVGWADVATRHDIVSVRQDLEALRSNVSLMLEAQDERFERRFAQIEAHVSRTVATWMLAGMGVQTAVIGLVVGLT